MSTLLEQFQALSDTHTAVEAAKELGVPYYKARNIRTNHGLTFLPRAGHVPQADASLILELRYRYAMPIYELAAKWETSQSNMSTFISAYLRDMT